MEGRPKSVCPIIRSHERDYKVEACSSFPSKPNFMLMRCQHDLWGWVVFGGLRVTRNPPNTVKVILQHDLILTNIFWLKTVCYRRPWQPSNHWSELFEVRHCCRCSVSKKLLKEIQGRECRQDHTVLDLSVSYSHICVVFTNSTIGRWCLKSLHNSGTSTVLTLLSLSEA